MRLWQKWLVLLLFYPRHLIQGCWPNNRLPSYDWNLLDRCWVVDVDSTHQCINTYIQKNPKYQNKAKWNANEIKRHDTINNCGAVEHLCWEQYLLYSPHIDINRVNIHVYIISVFISGVILVCVQCLVFFVSCPVCTCFPLDWTMLLLCCFDMWKYVICASFVWSVHF